MASLGSSPLNLTLTSLKSNTNGIGNYSVVDGKSIKSLFNNNKLTLFPTATSGDKVTSTKNLSSLHTNEDYDTSITKLVEYTSKIGDESKNLFPMKLKNSDFAYLKDVGVYPNNRLMIARRFGVGVTDDLTSVKANPLSTLISWTPGDADFIDIKFGEKWVEADASFEEVLNSVGGDLKSSGDNGGGLGTVLAGGANIIPLPGLMESLQYRVMNQLGVSDVTFGNLPLGNPNLIREAKRRETISKSRPGSGLVGMFSIKMVVEYEQKFINGVDPTLVYYDIISNALSFGTSESQFQFNSGLSDKASDFLKNLTSGTTAGFTAAIKQFIDAITSVIKAVGETIIGALKGGNGKNTEKEVTSDADLGTAAQGSLNVITEAVAGVIGKYKIQIAGIANALSGSPSAPWHITIGNPKRPLFSSGDMLVRDVTMKMGNTLSFNDLPSSIKLEFTLESARNLGAQEIFRKFNTGKGRTYIRTDKTFEESNGVETNKK